jgi:hypothetical protein
MTKQEALSLTAGSPSTIFTREDVHRLINAIDIPTAPEPSMACSCINEGFAEPCKNYQHPMQADPYTAGASLFAPDAKPLTDLDIADIADEIAAYIAQEESILDIDNAELSLDYNRTVQIDSCPIDEHELSEQIADQLVKQLAKRGLYQDVV